MASIPQVTGIRNVSEIMAMAARRLQIPDLDTAVFFDYIQEFMWTYRSTTQPVIKEYFTKTIPENRIIRQPVDMETFLKIGFVKPGGKVQEVGPNDMSPISPTGMEGDTTGIATVPIQSGLLSGYPGFPLGAEAISGSIEFLRPNIVGGAYTYNKEKKVFWLTPGVRWPNFYLVYRSNSMAVAKETLLPMVDAKALLYYILHNYTKDKNRGGEALKYEMDWLEARELMEDNASGFDLLEMINAIDQVRGYQW
jgi:hypothetical protein